MPFVYAVWAVRPGGTGRRGRRTDQAKRRGLERVGPIAHAEAPRLGWMPASAVATSNIMHFDLGPREQAGLHQYYMLACELGLARTGSEP